MMSKMQFSCEVMKISEDIKKVDYMLKSDAYKLLSTFAGVENKKTSREKVIKGYTEVVLHKIIDSDIFGGVKLDEIQTKSATNVIENLLNGMCEWLSIDIAIKKLEDIGVEFLDVRD